MQQAFSRLRTVTSTPCVRIATREYCKSGQQGSIRCKPALVAPQWFGGPVRSRSKCTLRARPAGPVRATAGAEVEEGEETHEVEIKVDGMVCGGCSSRVAEALKSLPNVKAVNVSLETKLATVEVAVPSQIDALQLLPKMVQLVKDLGFEAEPYIHYEFEG